MKKIRSVYNPEHLLCIRHHSQYFASNDLSVPFYKEGTIIIPFLDLEKFKDGQRFHDFSEASWVCIPG